MNSPFDYALREYGTKEILGSNSNPDVEKYFDATNRGSVKDDEAWCSAFVCWCHERAGVPDTNKANARSWLDWGVSIALPNAEIGDVVVLWRNSRVGAKGHVGFFVRQTATHVYLLGGNQNNEVCIMRYSKDRVLGVRRQR